MEITTTLNTGAQIPRIGLGTWRMHETTYESVLAALKAGYRHIDTATVYRNEEAVGRAIAESGATREELFITTKLWNDDQDDVEAALALSLKKLGLDYVDLYLMHWPLPTRVEAYREMEKLHASGKAKAIGVSNFTIRHLEQFLPQITVIPAVNQVEFNPFLNQAELLKFCEDKNIRLEAYCPLAHGSKLDDPRLLEIAGRYNKSPAQIMLRWSVQQGIIVIPKSSSPERLRENLNILDFEISSDDMNVIGTWNENSRICGDPTDMP